MCDTSDTYEAGTYDNQSVTTTSEPPSGAEASEPPPSLGGTVRTIMSQYRLTIGEVATASGISARSLIRMRQDGAGKKPRPTTLRRVAEAISDLTQLDSDELFRDLMTASGQEGRIRQGELVTRGAAELINHYQSMNPLGRRLLLQHARLLARELPENI